MVFSERLLSSCPVTHLVSTSFSVEEEDSRRLKSGSDSFLVSGVRCANSITLGVLRMGLEEQKPMVTQSAWLCDKSIHLSC